MKLLSQYLWVFLQYLHEAWWGGVLFFQFLEYGHPEFNQKKDILTMCFCFPVFVYSSMAVSKLEPELRDSIVSKYGDKVQKVYFNKGL